MSMAIAEALQQHVACRITIGGDVDMATLRRAFDHAAALQVGSNPLSSWLAEADHDCTACGTAQPVLFRYWPDKNTPYVIVLRRTPRATCEHVGQRPDRPIKKIYVLGLTALDGSAYDPAQAIAHAEAFARTLRLTLRQLHHTT